jgi:hypothetical protein
MISGSATEDALNPAIDANHEDKLLREMPDHVSDAQESVSGPLDLLRMMQQCDEEDSP